MATVLGYLEYNENNLGGGGGVGYLSLKGRYFFSEPSLRSDFSMKNKLIGQMSWDFSMKKQQHKKKS